MKKLLLILSLPIAIILSAPIFQTVRWSGHFELSVMFDSNEIDAESVGIAECWRKNQRDWLMLEAKRKPDQILSPLVVDGEGQPNAIISCSGSDSVFGLFRRYHEPESVLFHFRSVPDAQMQFQFIDIPAGRGNRQVILTP